jgi:hypothetical protein
VGRGGGGKWWRWGHQATSDTGALLTSRQTMATYQHENHVGGIERERERARALQTVARGEEWGGGGLPTVPSPGSTPLNSVGTNHSWLPHFPSDTVHPKPPPPPHTHTQNVHMAWAKGVVISSRRGHTSSIVWQEHAVDVRHLSHPCAHATQKTRITPVSEDCPRTHTKDPRVLLAFARCALSRAHNPSHASCPYALHMHVRTYVLGVVVRHKNPLQHILGWCHKIASIA